MKIRKHEMDLIFRVFVLSSIRVDDVIFRFWIYVAAKSALAGITKSLARALAPEIRVNAIAPGFVDTGFVDWTPEVLAELQKPTRLGRRISPEDVADAAVYLATAARSTTGQTILVDAGNAALG